MSNALTALAKKIEHLNTAPSFLSYSGLVETISQDSIGIAGITPFAHVGDRIAIALPYDLESVLLQVVRIGTHITMAKPFDDISSVRVGMRAHIIPPQQLNPCEAWKGRILNAIGEPLDGFGPLPEGSPRSSRASHIPALARSRKRAPLATGIHAIDIFMPLCFGQRIGIFAGSGVGKSILLAMLAQAERFDVTIVALVGERGREVREFLEDTLGTTRERTIGIVATGDESAMMRQSAALTAMSIAEHFRNSGQNVLLIVDSLTRYAHAARDIALAAGELPVARGYPPSVFSDLPALLERAGPGADNDGTITAIFSVLVDGDDHNEPISDAVRGTLDGHIVLSRRIAQQGRFPAIDIAASLSRLSAHALTPAQSEQSANWRAMIASYEDTKDLRALGGYVRGTDAALDMAVLKVPLIYAALKQKPGMRSNTNSFALLQGILDAAVAPGSAERPT